MIYFHRNYVDDGLHAYITDDPASDGPRTAITGDDLTRLMGSLNDPQINRAIKERYDNGPDVPPTPPDPYHPE